MSTNPNDTSSFLTHVYATAIYFDTNKTFALASSSLTFFSTTSIWANTTEIAITINSGNKLELLNTNKIKISTHLYPMTNNGYVLGNPDTTTTKFRWSHLYCKTLGNSTNKINDVWVKNINGLAITKVNGVSVSPK